MEKTRVGSPIKRLFLDIEVSPNVGLFWRPGRKVSINHDAIIHERAIMCVCWKWESEKRTHALTWDYSQNDRQLLVELAPIIEEADEVMAHFGDGFDIPWLRTRILFHGLNPMPLFKVVDTKAWASKHFLFNSDKLDYIAKFLFGEGKTKTEWEWWVDILMKNSRRLLAKMVEYCRKDVVLLERVWKRLAPHCPAAVHAGVAAGLDRWTCPRTGSKNVILSKRRATASGLVRYQMQNVDDGSYFSINQKSYESYLRNKRLQKVRGAAKARNGKR